MTPLCTRIYTHPFFEATPPGAAPGPPVSTGARVRHFRGCKNASGLMKKKKKKKKKSDPTFFVKNGVPSEINVNIWVLLLARLLEYTDCDTHQRTPKNSSIKLSYVLVLDFVGVRNLRALDLLLALSPLGRFRWP